MLNLIKLLIIIVIIGNHSIILAAMDSTNYSIPTDTINQIGDVTGSANYKIYHNLGEDLTGLASSTNYKVYQGFYTHETPILTFSLSATTVDLGTLRTDTVSTGNITLTISTNAISGYTVQAYDETDAGIANGFVSGSSKIADATTPNTYIVVPSAGTEHYGIVVTGTHAATGYASGTKINSLDNTTWAAIGSYDNFIADDTLTTEYRASISNITPANPSYQTTSTFILTGNF